MEMMQKRTEKTGTKENEDFDCKARSRQTRQGSKGDSEGSERCREVIYAGIRRTSREIVEAAIEENVEVIGLSCLFDAHMVLFPKVIELPKEKDARDIAVIGGSIIPEEDKVKLEKIGIKKIFGPGSSLDEIVNFIKGIKGEE